MSDLSVISAAIARLVGDDPLAPMILSALALDHPDSFSVQAGLALVAEHHEAPLERATHVARGRRERQHLAVIASWLHGDRQRAVLLAREHLSEFPDDVVVSWLSARR